MERIYCANFSYGDNNVKKWTHVRQYFKFYKGEMEPNIIIKNYRHCLNNFERFRFINSLLDEEREILVCSLNDEEFKCFIKILQRIVVVDKIISPSLEYLNNLYYSKMPKVKDTMKFIEVLVNNRPTKVIMR